MDLNQGESVLYTLELKGVQPPAPRAKTMKRLRKRLSPDTQIVMVNGGPSTEGNMYLRISVPEGYHFSKVSISLSHADTYTRHCPLRRIIFISGTLNLSYLMQEARSKFNVETQPDDAVVIEPLDGTLSPEGSATLHFTRSTPSGSLGRINCKACFCIL